MTTATPTTNMMTMTKDNYDPNTDDDDDTNVMLQEGC